MAAAVVTYQYPVIGTTAPTAIQASVVSSLACQVSMGDTDTTGVITHNWGLSAAQNTALQPWLSVWLQTPGTLVPILSFALSTNTVSITKVSATGSGGTYVVTLQRPNTIVQ